MGLQACLSPFEVQRFAMLARIWDTAITVVDTPGCGDGGINLTTMQRGALLRGDFTPVAQHMVAVARRHNPRLSDRPVHLTGYSMGASLAAAAAAAAGPRSLQLEHLMLIEPVALRRWPLPSLLRSVRLEDRLIDGYLADNEAVAGVVPLKDWQGTDIRCSRLDLALLGFGISRGGLTRDVLRAAATHQPRVTVVHGVGSRLSRMTDTSRLIGTCRQAGIDIHDVAVEGHHALWQSLPRVSDLAARAHHLPRPTPTDENRGPERAVSCSPTAKDGH
ncbi:hypothetical protein ACQ86B_29145 (plasmid) [Mycolicibacterium aichiense]|uniref:hypothetical protein n=1 Tax=Mycolicibacterium aichiense TaxID=1799 RepID=UPI003D668204